MHLDLAAPVDALAIQLIDIESVSGNESAIADAVETALRAQPHLAVIRDGDAIVARTSLGRDERVVVAGHLDTVPVAGNLPARVDGGVIWGRGTADMKAGVAVQLSLATALSAPSRDVTWVFYDHEEVEESKSGLGRLAANHRELLEADFAVLCEPTGGRIEGGCNGTLRVAVTIPGVAAHSARAWKGANAIHAAAPLLAVLAAYQPATVTVDGLDYREGLNAVNVSGGIASNVIPDACAVTINYRYAPDKTVEQALSHVHATLDGMLPERSTWDVTDSANACRPGLDAPLAQSFVEAVGATGAGTPRAKLGWTDVARFGALGIPAVNYGPGDPEFAHKDDEHVSIEQIHQVREGLAAWLSA